ncbi:MAG: FAD-binding oxidoreductase [Thermoplasmata archaeon]
MEKFKVKVIETVWDTPTVYLMRLQRTDGKVLDFIPGQWILARIEKNGNDVRRAYSIASPPFVKDHFELCIKEVEGGEMSSVLAAMEKGAVLDCAGPYGKFVLVDSLETDVQFVATGTGIAPLRSMIDTIFRSGAKVNVRLFFGVRREEQIIYDDHFYSLAERYENFEFIPTLSRPSPSWNGEKGYVQRLVKKYINGYNGEEVYLCGIPEMVDEVKVMFFDMGAPKERVHTEKWY